ncbi:MAG TPA: RidA family protein [Humidesulfovibrio sp.]|uniref:RidA family protein n=1 Tax=Humidesulfovibrio sp. TaxID=2910988 RepID=UPI002C9DCB2E|nr:RidA family protein [Humidesulfovibrio sp.]HWR02373.1 RidA family protein [Humidesulfovibrio sp.]
MPLELNTVHTNDAPAAIGPYSQAVTCGNMVYLSGQLGSDPATGIIPEDFAAQARQALTNLKAIVEAAGSSLERVVTVDVYLTEMTNFGAFNEVYAEFFSKHRPARAAIGVAALPREAQVEVRCIAALA